ncbi:uncharacterized protein LOC110683285 isoform X2 [Chenopodium quinoa]|uniref:uncharacterized protein LOC110683285 isoform X2 n=1 Tax=Chenopodium quinoa TaxID=63459 RepID=UPI000B793A02|nr:uncharacterized protein LOC110683285 isoform X2 [Chenopodium quinoa]
MESIVAPKGKKKQPKQKEKEKRMEKSSIGSSSTTSRNDMMGFLSKFGDLAKTLASNVKEMYGMLEQAKDLFVEEETTGKMQHLIDNIWCKYTTKTFVNQEEKKALLYSAKINMSSMNRHLLKNWIWLWIRHGRNSRKQGHQSHRQLVISHVHA